MDFLLHLQVSIYKHTDVNYSLTPASPVEFDYTLQGNARMILSM